MTYTFEIVTTQRCNMACTYCFEKEELQNPKIQNNESAIIKAVHKLLDSPDFNSIFDSITLSFWGGEPTLNAPLIIRLFEEFVNSPVNYFFYTNGFNANHITNILLKHKMYYGTQDNLSFQISYDGLTHDGARIDHSGNGTSSRILKNIELLLNDFPEAHFNLKSTIEVKSLLDMVPNWNHFHSLMQNHSNLKWSPTLEYTNTYTITPKFLENIEKEFLKIAKLEIVNFEENNKFVFSWFEQSAPALCTAGKNICNVDLDGNVSVCHGSLYSEDKKDFIFSHVSDDDIVLKIINSYWYYDKLLSTPELCVGCTATACFQCPTVQYSASSKQSKEERFHDPKIDLCDIYKVFGKIGRTTRKYLNLN